MSISNYDTAIRNQSEATTHSRGSSPPADSHNDVRISRLMMPHTALTYLSSGAFSKEVKERSTFPFCRYEFSKRSEDFEFWVAGMYIR